MERFSLEKWLQDKSRKVVTRDGREVDIYYSPTSRIPLIGRTSDNEVHQYTEDGFQYEIINQAKNDLFFADKEEEEELTDFEICCMEHFFGNALEPDSEGMRHLKRISQELLELARKELKDEAINNLPKYTYAQGRRDGYGEAFKSLPKWKKFLEEYEELDSHVLLLDNERVVLTGYLEKGDYYIELSELKKLPKEE